MKAREVVDILRRAGHEVDHVTGSHYILRLPNKPGRVVVPFHANRDLKRATLASIIRQADMSEKNSWDIAKKTMTSTVSELQTKGGEGGRLLAQRFLAARFPPPAADHGGGVAGGKRPDLPWGKSPFAQASLEQEAAVQGELLK